MIPGIAPSYSDHGELRGSEAVSSAHIEDIHSNTPPQWIGEFMRHTERQSIHSIVPPERQQFTASMGGAALEYADRDPYQARYEHSRPKQGVARPPQQHVKHERAAEVARVIGNPEEQARIEQSGRALAIGKAMIYVRSQELASRL